VTDHPPAFGDALPCWTRLDETLIREPALELRAQPDHAGGWTIRGERSVGTPQGALLLGFLHQTVQVYVVEVG
jgi:hypothetical protein